MIFVIHTHDFQIALQSYISVLRKNKKGKPLSPFPSFIFQTIDGFTVLCQTQI